MTIEDCYMTVGKLIQYIYENNIDLNSNIYVERIEDEYFENHGWKTIDKDNFEFSEEKDKYYKIFSYRKYKDDNKLYLTGHY